MVESQCYRTSAEKRTESPRCAGGLLSWLGRCPTRAMCSVVRARGLSTPPPPTAREQIIPRTTPP
eukprot:6093669-Alexandrium_andersonii.AAC.1